MLKTQSSALEHGFVKLSAVSPITHPGNPNKNCAEIKQALTKLDKAGVVFAVFPELALTSYSTADLFNYRILQQAALSNLVELKQFSKKINTSFVLGLPLEFNSKVYNCAALIAQGKIYGVVPKQFLPNGEEYYEQRWFAAGGEINKQFIRIDDEQVPFGVDLIFDFVGIENFKLAIEICEDLWTPVAPSCDYALAGATVIANLTASSRLVHKLQSAQNLVLAQSSRTITTYIYAGANGTESTAELVFSGQLLAAEAGQLLFSGTAGDQYAAQIVDTDLQAIAHQRFKNTAWKQLSPQKEYRSIELRLKLPTKNQQLHYPLLKKMAFLPESDQALFFDEITEICRIGLSIKLQRSNAKQAIIGLSGGLDSSLTLLLVLNCLAKSKDISLLALTMPGLGTSSRTKNNALALAQKLKFELLTIPIEQATTSHLKDIGWVKGDASVTLENAQSRERTQILMDLANKNNAIVIGTSDLSEIALGWSTYNGDQMSMYGLISDIPKTVVKALLLYLSEQPQFKAAQEILKDIANTPISPELLPLTNGSKQLQDSEQILGSYELNDFYLYHFLKTGASPSKLFFLAKIVFKEQDDYLKMVLKSFFSRFFKNQFKRNANPDGVKVGSINLSSKSDWRMPSDLDAEIWLAQIDAL